MDSPTLVAAGHIRELGRRIELVSMDRWLEDITIGLYRQGDPPTAFVHSYATNPRVPERCRWIAETMAVLTGFELVGGEPRLRSTCEDLHERATRRAFLEACRLDPSAPVREPAPAISDTRSAQRISVSAGGGGRFTVHADNVAAGEISRASAVAAGLAKLGDLEVDPSDTVSVQFSCGVDHERLIALLLPRSLNARAAVREVEGAATRGVLSAPSAQNEATA